MGMEVQGRRGYPTEAVPEEGSASALPEDERARGGPEGRYGYPATEAFERPIGREGIADVDGAFALGIKRLNRKNGQNIPKASSVRS
jgi:hypothetical protein